MTVTTEQLETFCREAANKARPNRLPDFALTFSTGKKYARIKESGGGVFCFVNLADGTILKAASWNTPAKQSRGNIANGAKDVTAYGAAYIR
jgi:hypothetical protein